MVVGENTRVPIAQRERQQLRARCVGELQVELGMLHHGHRKSRRLWVSLPRSTTEPPYQAGGRSSGLRMEAACGARQIRRSIGLDAGKSPSNFQRHGPQLHPQRSNSGHGKPSSLCPLRHRNAGPSAAPVHFKIAPTWLELDRCGSSPSLAQCCNFARG